jgi:hypothetical protein
MDVAAKFHAGYGDGPPQGQGPAQAEINTQGNAYLDAGFPELTKILKATIQEAPAAAPPAN